MENEECGIMWDDMGWKFNIISYPLYSVIEHLQAIMQNQDNMNATEGLYCISWKWLPSWKTEQLQENGSACFPWLDFGSIEMPLNPSNYAIDAIVSNCKLAPPKNHAKHRRYWIILMHECANSMRRIMVWYDAALFPAINDFTKQILPGRGLATTGNKWLARHCPNVAWKLCSCSTHSHHLTP